jgi:hypothetical protein
VAERANFPREICDMALAHHDQEQSREGVSAERRELMARWDGFVTSAPPSPSVPRRRHQTEAHPVI